jgi:MFS family permease
MSKVPSPRAALALLTAVNLLNYLDRYIPFAVLPALSRTLRLTDAQAGSLQTLFILSYALVSPAIGWLGDRRPRFSLAVSASRRQASWSGAPPRSPRGWRRRSRRWCSPGR